MVATIISHSDFLRLGEACYLKLGEHQKCVDACNQALQLGQNAKAGEDGCSRSSELLRLNKQCSFELLIGMAFNLASKQEDCRKTCHLGCKGHVSLGSLSLSPTAREGSERRGMI